MNISFNLFVYFDHREDDGHVLAAVRTWNLTMINFSINLCVYDQNAIKRIAAQP
jgi:hypothetical protein